MSEQDEIARLRSIMAAAADEIEEHWKAHCDDHGFGPVNLVRRLRTGKGDYRGRGCAMSDDLARRAVACRHWRWAPGMLSRCATPTRRAVYRWLVGLDTRHYGLVCIVQDKHGRPCRNVATLQPGPDDLPDLTDPATLGCLLALVREAWGDPYVYVLSCAPDWFTVCSPNAEGGKWLAHPPIDGSTEAAALVAALEAAP